MRDGGTITERPDGTDPTVELHRDDLEAPRTRLDLPQRADPTREDLPRRTPADEPVVPFDSDATVRRRRTPWRWVVRTFFLVVALLVGTPLAAGFYVWYVAREDVRTHSDA